VVGIGWHAGHCFHCEDCRGGDFTRCVGVTGFSGATGISRDGGMAEYVSARWDSLIIIPKALASNPRETAPLLCAGVTVFTAIREAKINPGEVLLVQGMGGLGHLAVQYSAKMGYYTVVLTTSPSKGKAALELGANEVIEVKADNSHLKRLQELGKAKVIIATAPDASGIGALTKALAKGGNLIMVGVPHEPVSFNPMDLVVNSASITGWVGGNPGTVLSTLKASITMGVKSVVETYPISRAAEAFKAMKENKVYFRAVIVPDSLL